MLRSVLATAFFVAITVAHQPAQAATYKQAQYIMGTVFEITLDSPQDLAEEEREALFNPLFSQLRAYDQHLSHYRKDSDLSRVILQWQKNQKPIRVPPVLCEAISRAKDYHTATAGAFDITVGPLVKLWGFKDKAELFTVPSALSVQKTLEFTGFRGLSFDASHCILVALPLVDNALDFGAMGKGMAIDAALAYFEDHLQALHPLLSGFAIQGGGSSAYFWGAPTDSPQGWPIMPRQGGAVYWLKNQALGVSGLKENYGVYNGRVYGHILDPRSGYALSGPAQLQRGEVYVIADRAEIADVFSTTLWVVDETKAQQLAQDFNFRFWWQRPTGQQPILEDP